MAFSTFTTLSVKNIEVTLTTDISTGLDSTEAANRLIKDGPNLLKVVSTAWYDILLRQFKSAFVYILLAAAFASFLWGANIDAIFILLFVGINAALGFYQEFKSEQAVNLLKSFVQPKVKVLRNDEEVVILGKELVVGDVVLLETGDIVPADLRVVTEHDCTVDESILTGESLQVKKTADPLKNETDILYKAQNILFTGTAVVSGTAKGVVVDVGANTEIGKITKLTAETVRISGFEKQINKFSKFTLYLIVGTLAVVFVAHLFLKPETVSIKDLALFIITLAVGVIPEALPLVITFSLSRGAVSLAKKKVVVKRLSSIEDLGSIEILCSDKTGTLTENKLTVAETNTILGYSEGDMLLYGLLASNVTKQNTRLANNSFDLAIETKAGEKAIATSQKYKRVAEIPFDPERKRNSVLVDFGNSRVIVVRGAHENILPYVHNVDPKKAEEMAKWIVAQGTQGRRVIAVAVKKDFVGLSYEISDEQSDLELVGLMAFYDPIKQSTKEAVEKASKLKVAIKILTGDSREVAGAVAYQVGISDSPKKVMTGEEFERLDGEEQYKAVTEYSVFARVSPEQKYKIIGLLEKNHQVGYLGEGINDAPALKAANVGLVVEGAADIAREAADIVLLSRNLDVIINGIEEGRKTFVNTVKYIKSTLTSNFGNFYSVAFASLLIDYLPMLPIQILLVNLLSDFPMISIATDSVEVDELKNPQNYDIKEIILIATLLGTVSSLFDFIFFGIFKSGGEGVLQTNWFIGSILTELVLLYSIRTKRVFFKPSARPSWQVVVLTLVAAIATVSIPLTVWGRNVFGFILPSLGNYTVVFGLVVAYFVCTEVVKLGYYHTKEK